MADRDALLSLQLTAAMATLHRWGLLGSPMLDDEKHGEGKA